MREVWYVWDGQNVLIETNASNVIEAVHTLEPRYFGNQISQLRSGVASYYHYDLQGSTLHLTNAAGTLTNTYVYNAWGVTLSSSGSTVNPYQFIGRKGYIFDTDLGNYQVRARRYGPVIGRWWSRDPTGFAGRDANLYRYVGNGPTFATDPSGLDWLDDITDNWVYKWIYTGDANLSTDKYREFCTSAGDWVNCDAKCLADVNKQLAAVAGGAIGSITNARDVLPFPKWLAAKLGFRVSGESWFTSLARLKSTHPERFKIPLDQRKIWKTLANQIKSRPAMGVKGDQIRQILTRGAKGGVAVTAVLEMLITWYCYEKCKGKQNQ